MLLIPDSFTVTVPKLIFFFFKESVLDWERTEEARERNDVSGIMNSQEFFSLKLQALRLKNT